MNLTPTQLASHERSKAFHASISEKAAHLSPKPVRSYSIPNTPFGIPKHREPVETVRPWLYYHSMWFFDLVTSIHKTPQATAEVITVDKIQRAVCAYFEISKIDLISQRRTKDIVKPRQIAMYLCKTLTGRSLPEIGRRFGGRDHSTVLFAVKSIEGAVISNLRIAHDVAVIKALVQP